MTSRSAGKWDGVWDGDPKTGTVWGHSWKAGVKGVGRRGLAGLTGGSGVVRDVWRWSVMERDGVRVGECQ